MYCNKSSPDHLVGHRHLGQLECNGAGVTDDARADLDQLDLEAGQRSLGRFLGQFDTAQEGCHVVGQHVRLEAHLVVAELLA